MYPTVVMFFVESQRSMTDICETSPSNASPFAGPQAFEACPATLGHLSFAVGPMHTTIDDESESQRSCALQSPDGQEHNPEKVGGLEYTPRTNSHFRMIIDM